jgi:hypothetical protein
MADPENGWPDYLWAFPTHDVFAIGVISLNYIRLESIFLELFYRVTNMPVNEVKALFHRHNNPDRIATFLELLAKSDLPEQFRQPAREFVDAFKKCADNRNAPMHSFSPGLHTSESTGAKGILLIKYSRTGDVFAHAATLPELRRIADDMHEWAGYGAATNSRIRILRSHRLAGAGDSHMLRVPWPAKPQPPIEVTWEPFDWRIDGTPPPPAPT